MNVNKVKKCHINMEQFIRENQFGINKIEELAERAARIWNEVRDEIKLDEPLLNDRLIKHGIPEYLSARSISLLEECDKSGRTYFFSTSCDRNNKYTTVNIFGYLKIGQRSAGELADDVLNLYVYDEKYDTRYLDLDRAIQIGLKYKPFDEGANDFSHSMGIVFDIDATLIRALSTGTVLGNEEEVDKAIIRTMVDRIIVMMVSRLQLSAIVDNYINVDYSSQDDSIYDVKEVLKVAFIYKIWYNAVNGINDVDVEKSVESVLDLVNLASHSFNATQAIPDVYNTIHSKVMTGGLDVDRYPDRAIEEAMEMYRKATTYYSFRDDNGRRSHAQYVRKKTVIGVESLAFESMLQTIGITRGFRDKKRASMSLIGIESIQQSTREFDEFKRKSRGAIMAKLEYKERITYVKYESDVMKFRAEAIGCRTEFTKGTILKRGETIGKLIQMELSRDHSEEFVTLMCMLDSERVVVQTELANRDIFKEKNTMLNGMIVTKNEWNY